MKRLMLVMILLAGCGERVVVVPQSSSNQEVPRDMTSDAPLDLFVSTDTPKDHSGASDQSTRDHASQDMMEMTQPDESRDLSTQSKTYTVAVISDLNGSYGSTVYSQDVHRAVTWLKESVRPDVVLATGDMVAGQKQGLNYKAMWSSFHNAVTSPLAQANIPFAPTPGNHDASGYDAFAQERSTYIDQWQANRPRVEFVEQTYYPLYYAFKVGPALFISLDDTIIGKLGGPQMTWLEDILKAHADVPLKFVYGHVPLYAVAQGRESEIMDDAALEDLLNRHGVTAFISGHHHAYYPGRRGPLRLVSMGCLGAGARRLIGETSRSAKSVVVFHYNASGIMQLDAYTGATYQQVINRESLPPQITHNAQTIVRDDL